MKLQRFKENEAVVMVEHAAAHGLKTNSNMTYSIVSEYRSYILACIDFDDIEFFWPPRSQHGKEKTKEQRMRKYNILEVSRQAT